MRTIEGEIREEMKLMCLEEEIEEEDEVRVVDAIIDALDLEKIGFKEKERKSEAGRPRYDEKLMLKLYVYSYRNGIRSGRKIENACKYDVRYRWLMQERRPDANTINDFRKNNIELITAAFYEINRIYIKMGILKIKDVSQDGYKVRAVNSKEKNYTKNKLIDRIKREEKNINASEEEIKKLEEESKKVEEYLDGLEKSEELEKLEEEIEQRKKELEEIKKEIEEKEEEKNKEKERKEKHEKMIKEMKEEDKNQISLTDPESRLMKNNGKFEVCYNTQVAVDMETHATVGIETDNNPADIGSMGSLTKKIKDEYEEEIEEPITNVTDKGYQSIEDMVECLEQGVIPQVTPNDKKEENVMLITQYEENEISEEERKSIKAEDIQKCIRAGEIPECYKDVIEKIEVEEVEEKEEIEEEVEEENKSSEEIREEAIKRQIFKKDENIGIVYCPMGEVLSPKSKRSGNKIRYANKLACKNCKNPCTKSKYREVEMKGNQREVIPKTNEQEKPRKKQYKKIVTKKVKITLKLDREKLKKRMQTSEHSQGTLKTVNNFNSFSMRGKVAAEGEQHLYYIGSNIRCMTNRIGVTKMLEKIEELVKNEEKMVNIAEKISICFK